MLSVDSNFCGCFELHSNVNVGVFTASYLNDRQPGTEARQLLAQFGHIFLEILADFPAEESINGLVEVRRNRPEAKHLVLD